MTPLFHLSASLSECVSLGTFRDRLRAMLADDPALPFTLSPDGSGHILRPTGAAELPAGQAVFLQVVNNLHARLVTLDRQARVNGLAEQFARRDEENPSLSTFAEELCRIFEVRGLAGLGVAGGALRRVPHWDAGKPVVPAFTPEDVGVIRAGEVSFRPDGVLLPLGGKYRPRAAFWLDAGTPDRTWPDADRALLRQLGHQLGLEVERLQAVRYSRSLQVLHAELLGSELEDAYQPLLERALATIPGAECGSLLIREGEVFRYAASVTFDETELSEVTFPVGHTRDRWYGLGEEAWRRGVPRVQSRGLLAAHGTGYDLHGERVNAPLPSVAGIQANIGVPILYQGEVYAFLNVDSMTDPEAFDRESIDLAQSFARQAALLLHEARMRAQVHAAARTDVLTGLQNRRAFTESLTRELARARRHALPLSLLVADIRAFKAVNDTHGHLVGDQALMQVGEVLLRELRVSDVVFRPAGRDAPAGQGGALEVFRWGGDEFAVLLPETDLAGARVVRERLRAAMRGTDVAGQPIELNVGVAALRDGDVTGEVMLREADDAMYRDKQGSR
jgi:GGDEF domain-containing protein